MQDDDTGVRFDSRIATTIFCTRDVLVSLNKCDYSRCDQETFRP